MMSQNYIAAGQNKTSVATSLTYHWCIVALIPAYNMANLLQHLGAFP